MTDIYLYDQIFNKNTKYNVWMAYPAINSFALSSLGFMSLFADIDKNQNVNVEKICTDTNTTKINIKDVDAICFSFSFDMDFIGIFSILEKYNIPFKAENREKYPLIFCGGPVVTANPEPYKKIFDFFVIGDGEDVNKKIIDTCCKAKENNLTKIELLTLLSKIEGVYIPDLTMEVKKASYNLSRCICTPIISENSFFSKTFIIEITRGCYNRCGFCLASYLNLPVRFVDYEEIIQNIELGLKYTDKIALLGALISAHPQFDDICKYIYDKIQNGQKIELSVSSLRTDAITHDIVKTLFIAGQKSTTIAIEAASERLRKIINKNITEQQIINAVEIIKKSGMNGVKIYSMIGLPTETQYDIDEFLRLATVLKNNNKGFDITFSFSTFVPKPHTPFQWCARESIKSLERKQKYLQKELHKIGIKSKFSSPKWDYYQTLLSRGNEGLTDFLIDVYNNGAKLGAFKSAAKKYKINTVEIAEREFDINEKLPWDFIKINPGREFLQDEYLKLISH